MDSTVAWSATAPDTGRFAGDVRTTGTGELARRLTELRTQGSGHVQVELPGADYPHLTMSFVADRAVVHAFFAEDRCTLLAGDGVADRDDVVEITVADDDYATPFTGDVVVSLDRASEVIAAFCAGEQADSLGDWIEL